MGVRRRGGGADIVKGEVIKRARWDGIGEVGPDGGLLSPGSR
jgi:hypothetical protein